MAAEDVIPSRLVVRLHFRTPFVPFLLLFRIAGV